VISLDIKFWLGYVSEWLGALAVTMIVSVSPLLKKIRQVEYRFPQREATFALSLFALIYLVAFQYFTNPALAFAKKAASAFAGGELAEHMLLAAVCLVPFLLALLLRGQPFKSIGWAKDNLKAGATLGALLAVVTLFLRGKFTTLLNGISSEQGSLLLVWLILAIAEEMIFRGYIQSRIAALLGTTWGWLATAGLFVLWQLPGRLWVSPFADYWQVLVIAAIQGLLLGWIMRKSNHVLAPILYRVAAGWLLLI
jgi:membrane protease YdiL (CAAX protease family)